MTPSVLAFVYALLATPFLTWAVFKYNHMKANKIYVKAIEDDLTVVKEKMESITENMQKLLTEVNSLKIKEGFSGKEKSFFN